MCHLCIQPAEVWYGLADKPVSQTIRTACILLKSFLSNRNSSLHSLLRKQGQMDQQKREISIYGQYMYMYMKHHSLFNTENNGKKNY